MSLEFYSNDLFTRKSKQIQYKFAFYFKFIYNSPFPHAPKTS